MNHLLSLYKRLETIDPLTKITPNGPEMSLFVAEDDQQEILIPLNNGLSSANVKTTTSEEDIVDTRFDPIDVSLSLPLKFQQNIIQDLIQDDGLLIMGKGLGIEPITANLVHVLSAPSTLNSKKTKRSLIILLNALEDENTKIAEALLELSWLDSFDDLAKNLEGDGNIKRPFVVIGGDTVTIDKRRKIYTKGGIISVTSRVFIVDMLSGIIDANLITGIVLLHAERIKETSNEAFILTLYKEQNSWGFVKALSDEPESFTRGFQPLYNKLKSLKLSKSFLWPRFHIDVTSSLQPKKRKSNQREDLRSIVTEVNVRMTDSMEKIQIAILGCIEACIAELRRHNPTISTEYWTSQNALDNDFLRIIRASLDPVWHRVSWTTKQLVYDLSTLKELLTKLLTYDSIRYYETVQQIYESNKPSVNVMKKNQSPWLMLDEATTILSFSKKRVFEKIKKSDEELETYLLEEQPKWEQLALLLEDISEDKLHRDDSESGPILIMCSDSIVCRQLRQFITTLTKIENDSTLGRNGYSGRNMMVEKVQSYLSWKDALVTTTQQIQKQMLENQQRATMLQKQQTLDELNTSKTFTRGKAPPGKRRRTRGGSVVAAVGRLHSADIQRRDDDVDITLIDKLQDEIIKTNEDNDEDSTPIPEIPLNEWDIADAVENDIVITHQRLQNHSYDYIDRKDQIIIEKFNDRTDDMLLQELMPSYIIMYEPDLSFIRRVEVYQALNKDNPARTFFMYYGSSVEEEIHLSNIKKEKEIFTKLIREKGQLASSYSTSEDNTKFQSRKTQVYNTRIAGGSNFKDPNQETRVIADIREFSGSQLPILLHKIGIKIMPCMLTVGDYIISPRICIERKAIPDLISSFKSGRLYTQCEQMFRYYEIPTLLIEFDENKSFSLEPFSELRSKNNNQVSLTSIDPVSSKLLQQDIQSKLMMLLIAFPKLKIIWSSSPYQTAQIILELKAKQEEPDPDVAVNLGLEDQDSTVDGPPRYNDNAIDLIQNIPGINNVNYHLIIQKVKNLKDLVSMSEDELAEIIGKEPASKAYNFINRNNLKN